MQAARAPRAASDGSEGGGGVGRGVSGRLANGCTLPPPPARIDAGRTAGTGSISAGLNSVGSHSRGWATKAPRRHADAAEHARPREASAVADGCARGSCRRAAAPTARAGGCGGGGAGRRVGRQRGQRPASRPSAAGTGRFPAPARVRSSTDPRWLPRKKPLSTGCAVHSSVAAVERRWRPAADVWPCQTWRWT